MAMCGEESVAFVAGPSSKEGCQPLQDAQKMLPEPATVLNKPNEPTRLVNPTLRFCRNSSGYASSSSNRFKLTWAPPCGDCPSRDCVEGDNWIPAKRWAS